jgi:hemerythrin-like domain-containing protein
MPKIQAFMAGDHRRCDDIFNAIEQAVEAGAWARASAAFARFEHALLQHFAAEEAVLFPAFEAKTGMTTGPTQVMRGEHAQMRELLAAAREGLLAQDGDDYSGNAETLLIMMQQHNAKEENVLYPMCDQFLAAQLGDLLPELESLMPSTTA